MSAETIDFPGEDFLLHNASAKALYRVNAAHQPIIDYHCHLPVKEIAENRTFENLTQIWLAGDHYKWRAMRTCGVPERFITGDATDREKFQKWAETVPRTLRNPLYHWTHLELRRPFGITGTLLDGTTAQKVWDSCNDLLRSPEFSVRGILTQMKVKVVCTTDDPTDDLRYHRAIAADATCGVKVVPAFRPDRVMLADRPDLLFPYLETLGAAAGMEIRTFADLVAAIDRRHEFFHAEGCRLSDHALETVPALRTSDAEVGRIFARLLQRQSLTPEDVLRYRSEVLFQLGLMNHKRGWVQQLHIGALRNTNTRMMKMLGPDTGFDTIGDLEVAKPLAAFLDRLDTDGCLAKTILYNLNPRDNELYATMIGNFQDGSVPGKIQYGAAWWFLDQLDGMTRQLNALSNMGLLSQFIGMLTDSRSFLSFPRHDYFRRLLCNMLGTEMEQGLLPGDLRLVGAMVEDISYGNAARYFPFAGPVR
jgi:glucuronate isomerase